MAGATVTAPSRSGFGSVTLTSAPCGSWEVRSLAITSPVRTAGLPPLAVVSVALPVLGSYAASRISFLPVTCRTPPAPSERPTLAVVAVAVGRLGNAACFVDCSDSSGTSSIPPANTSGVATAAAAVHASSRGHEDRFNPFLQNLIPCCASVPAPVERQT